MRSMGGKKNEQRAVKAKFVAEAALSHEIKNSKPEKGSLHFCTYAGDHDIGRRIITDEEWT